MLIIRSINTSIGRLERATRQIADGDLDFALDTTGRDRIASLTRSFDDMRRQLKEQFDRGSRFLMGISHDLKTPLSSISGYIDAIRDGYADSPEKLQKYTSIVQMKTQLLESRISALIDYARNETREWKATLESVVVADFLTEFLILVEAEAHARRFGFSSSIEVPPDLSVPMDADMVNRALENLVENAFVYATPESEIRVRAVKSLGAIEIAVENEGAGINPEDIPHIFDPLFRSSANRAGDGFGLGLATVKSVVSSHGWQIRAESEPAKHTRFVVTIPIHHE
jgi:signal transduction histidine kinase